MEREPEQAALAAGRDLRAQVEERRRLDDASPDQADSAALLDDEQPAAVGRRLGDEDGLAEAARDPGERQVDVAGDERGRRDGRCRRIGEVGDGLGHAVDGGGREGAGIGGERRWHHGGRDDGQRRTARGAGIGRRSGGRPWPLLRAGFPRRQPSRTAHPRGTDRGPFYGSGRSGRPGGSAYHPAMLLAIDIGNSNLTIGLFRAGALRDVAAGGHRSRGRRSTSWSC